MTIPILIVLLTLTLPSKAEFYRRYASTSIPDVLHAATKGDVEAILELGYRPREGTDVLLRISRQLDTPRKKKKASFAKMALAKKGDNNLYEEFRRGLSSPDREVKLISVYALGYIGRRISVKDLVPLLAPESPPPPFGNPMPASIPFAVTRALADILGEKDSPGSRTPADWQKWWETNRKQFK
jgi:HEAT repeat protein